MRMYDLIEKKKHGESLSAEEILVCLHGGIEIRQWMGTNPLTTR